MKKIWSYIKNLFLREGQLRPCVVPIALLICISILGGIGLVRVATQVTHTLKLFQNSQTQISKNDEDLGIVKMDAPEGITSIALFGVDSRDTEFAGLSDSIMIITIDAEHNDIKITSILRDSLVKIDGYGHQKINAAYNLGGAQLAIKTLNQTFDMNIRDYATVDFVSMADIINAVGGIEAELTAGEVKQANAQIWDMYVTRGTPYEPIEQEGKQTLSGVQAVAFARIRKTATINGTNDDVGRTERQRYVMRQLFDKALAMNINKYPAMIQALLPCMETSLSYNEIFKLAGILTNSGITLKEERLPADEAIIVYGLQVKGLGSCKYYNLDYAADMLNAFVFEDVSFEEYIEENGVDRTEWFFGELEEGEPEEEEEPIEEEETPPAEEEETPPAEEEETPPAEEEETPPAEEEETPPAEEETPPAEEEETPPAEEEEETNKKPTNKDEVWFPGKDQGSSENGE